MRSPARTAIVVASAGLLLAGCSGGKDTKDATSGGSSGTSSSGSGGSSGSSGSSGSGGSASTTPPQPIVQQQTQPITGKMQGEVVLAITAVQVRGKLATVGLTFTPTLPQESSDATFSLYSVAGFGSVDMSLVDPVNLKRYAVVKDSNSKLLAPNEGSISARNGGSAGGTYTFAAPPEDVKNLDVYLGQFPPFTNVPVRR